jgi:Flp pilus assembly protein TadD
MKPLTSLMLALALLASAGCGKKEISQTDRKQAISLASEANFASGVREYARAEGLMAQAAQLCPDDSSYWIGLGAVRVRLSKQAEARDAYKRALSAAEQAYKKDPKMVDAALNQVYILALLGRADDARSFQNKLLEKHPESREVRGFVESKQLDRILADPQFKQIAL